MRRPSSHYLRTNYVKGYEYETYEGSRSNILEGIESIESGEMPPPGYPKVPEAQLEILKSWVGKSY